MPVAFVKRHLSRELIVQLMIFGVVGVTATLTHYFTALLSHELGGIDLYLANLFGYVAAVMVSFFGHGRFTFKQELNWGVFVRFSIVSVSTFFCSELILLGLEKGLDLPHRISLAVVVSTIPLITFVLSKLWVFRPPAQRENPKNQ
ncbi:Putative flippase GtrA (transmembrane translocase of bactoprenol-linked glucose) [Alteromonadaceae bacterium Bs31]|nr:Putative flippase GtrA (transmembrane translocase of bactoprenol-linked glucose) [Alteromonadaceae bacterium Bs31]